MCSLSCSSIGQSSYRITTLSYFFISLLDCLYTNSISAGMKIGYRVLVCRTQLAHCWWLLRAQKYSIPLHVPDISYWQPESISVLYNTSVTLHGLEGWKVNFPDFLLTGLMKWLRFCQRDAIGWFFGRHYSLSCVHGFGGGHTLHFIL